MGRGRPKHFTQSTLEIVKDGIKALPDHQLEILINMIRATILERRKDSLLRLSEKANKAFIMTPSDQNRWLVALIDAKLHEECGLKPLDDELGYKLARMYEDKYEGKLKLSKYCIDKISACGLYDGLVEYIYKHTKYDEFFAGRFMRRS